MTILRRILFVVIVATGALWFVTNRCPIVFASMRLVLRAADGDIELVTGRTARSFFTHIADRRWFVMGHQSFRWSDLPYASLDKLTIPFWMILAVLLPPWWLMGGKSRQRKRWANQGRCLSCGYNLQGSESGTCSECGEVSAMRQ